MTNKIDKMTPEQEAKIPEYLEKYTKIGKHTEIMDRPLAEKFVKEMYPIILKQTIEPKVVFCESPLQMVVMSAVWELLEGPKVDALSMQDLELIWQALDIPEKKYANPIPKPTLDLKLQALVDEIEASFAKTKPTFNDQLRNVYYVSWWSSYRAVFDFATTELGVVAPPDVTEQFTFILKAFKELHALSPYEGVCFVSEFPKSITTDDRGRLHNLTEGAIVYRDGYSLYSVKGIKIVREKSHMITAPHTLTVKEIEDETNTEIRRTMMEIYGQERFLMDSKSKKVHEDDFGILYRKEIPNDEALQMVKVVNSTPEPDGTFKDYFIRVPPSCVRAKEAVAWTFGMTEADYCPSIQT